jgi:type VI secretion system secreted protein VgrG
MSGNTSGTGGTGGTGGAGGQSSGASTGGDTQGDTYITITIDPDPGIKFRFNSLNATEELGRPFQFKLGLTGDKVKTDTTTMLGSSVTVSMTDAQSQKKYFNGVIASIRYSGVTGGVYHYQAELRPQIWLLTRKQDCKIFQKMSPFDIINKVLKDAGFSALQDKRQNQTGSTPTLDYCVQYRETSFDFVTRLMEQYGIYYYFEHSETEHTLVFADDPGSHTAVSSQIPFQTGQVEHRAVQDHVAEFNADHTLQPGSFSHRDYNFETPSADLTTKSVKPGDHKYGDFEVYDYPGLYGETGVGQKLTDTRMQHLTARVQQFAGKTNSREMRCGMKYSLSKFHEKDWNQEYLITHATTTLTAAEGASDTRGNLIDTHRVEYSSIVGTTQYRLEPKTKRPTVHGPQTALVVGESGDEITTNKYGQIKVQFYWDRDGQKNQDSSCWIRVAHSWGGIGWGSIVIPRVGMEVMVNFLEGNPDRPIVTGVVYNATQTVPNTLPDKKVLSTFKTNSSKGGGGYNELTFDDTKGTEKVTFQAQYDYDKTVLHSETVNITQDTTTTVKQGDRSVTVSQGNDSHTVSQGNRSATVSVGNDSLTVSAGNLSISVSAGATSVTSGQSITLTVGANSITINQSGITISGAMVSLSGTASMSLSAPMISIN